MKTFRVNEIDLATVDQGAGRPVLLVHGFPLDHTMWDRQIEALSATHRVIAPDLRGFGRSGVSQSKVTMEAFADDLASLLDALAISEPVVYCGLSMGGYIGWEFVRKYRDKVRSLIQCDTKAAADSPEAAKARLLTAERVLTEGSSVVADSMLEKLFSQATRDGQTDLVKLTRQVMLQTDPKGIAAALKGMAERRDFRSTLASIDLPTLLIVGEHDPISPPAEMREMAAAIPGARLVEIESAGHMAPLERPDEVNRALAEFLSSGAR